MTLPLTTTGLGSPSKSRIASAPVTPASSSLVCDEVLSVMRVAVIVPPASSSTALPLGPEPAIVAERVSVRFAAMSEPRISSGLWRTSSAASIAMGWPSGSLAVAALPVKRVSSRFGGEVAA
jgi:hypothetical protein